MTPQDRKEFAAYLKGCTDNQVLGVLEKEREAGRQDYAHLAELEASKRNLV
jgi:hypothetical protein